jgi:hypothetical protein
MSRLTQAGYGRDEIAKRRPGEILQSLDRAQRDRSSLPLTVLGTLPSRQTSALT